MPIAGRDNAECFESLLAPFEELVTLAVAAEFHFEVELERFGTAEEIDLHGVVDDEINGDKRLDHGRILARGGHGIAHRRQIDEERHAGEVLQDNAGDNEGNFLRGGFLGIPCGQRADVLLADLASIAIAQNGFEHDTDADRQARDGAEAGFLEAR